MTVRAVTHAAAMAGSTLLAVALAVVQPAAPDHGPRNVLDYGADPTGQQDSTAAFDKACNDWPTIKGLHKYAGGTVYVPRGVYRLDKPLHLLRGTRLTGDGPESSVLRCQGIVTHNHLTARDEGLEGACGGMASIENLGVYYGGGEAVVHGIDMRAGIVVRDVVIEGFSGNGVNIDTRDDLRNANRFRLDRVIARKNEHGIYIIGDDSNAGTTINCDVRTNRGWGLWEQSFLGNCHIGLHTGYNATGALYSGRHTAKNAYINCYQEGSNHTHPIVMTAGDTVLGGISFQYEEIQAIPGGGRPVVINQVCSPLPIRGDGHEVTIGGSDILAFRPTGSQMYRLKFDDRRKVLMLSYANSPAMAVEFAAEGHTEKPMTLLRVNQ